MASEAKKNPDDRPPRELSPEMREFLDNMNFHADEAQKDIDAMSELGLDPSRLQDTVDLARKIRETMLKRFGVKE